jgi:hypothetical protein
MMMMMMIMMMMNVGVRGIYAASDDRDVEYGGPGGHGVEVTSGNARQ